MSDYLRVQDGIAVELWTAPEGTDLADCFPEDLAATFHPKGRGKVGWVWDGNAFSSPPEPGPGPVLPVITYKADLFRRATEAEADMIDTALSSAPAKERRLFEMAQYLDHSAPEFASMETALIGMFGTERAAELLAAS